LISSGKICDAVEQFKAGALSSTHGPTVAGHFGMGADADGHSAQQTGFDVEEGMQRSEQRSAGWAPFERWTSRYDQWFDSEKGERIFRVEAACMRDLLVDAPRPWLEIGVGTGRFAEVLHVDEGTDPSPAVLGYAAERGIKTHVGEGEDLYYGNNHFGAVLLIVTICFLRDPSRVLSECHRVLKPGGFLLLGLVPKNSSWGQNYMAEGQQGHPFYSAATFYTTAEIVRMCERAGFFLEDSRSCLLETPDSIVTAYGQPEKEIVSGAGFVSMRFAANKEKGRRDDS
jgi:ubiquinone/menaquinone biosynthesis C-methylase UbiE